MLVFCIADCYTPLNEIVSQADRSSETYTFLKALFFSNFNGEIDSNQIQSSVHFIVSSLLHNLNLGFEPKHHRP